ARHPLSSERSPPHASHRVAPWASSYRSFLGVEPDAMSYYAGGAGSVQGQVTQASPRTEQVGPAVPLLALSARGFPGGAGSAELPSRCQAVQAVRPISLRRTITLSPFAGLPTSCVPPWSVALFAGSQELRTERPQSLLRIQAEGVVAPPQQGVGPQPP